MEIDPSRLDWNHLRAFVATADKGTLSGAARQLGLTQPTLGRQIAALEDSLSLMLFERHGRRLILTEAGQHLLAHAREMGEAAQRLSLSASGQRSEVQGVVRITASDVMAVHAMPQVLAQVRRRAPRLTVEIIASDDIMDLMRRDADIALRHMRPEQPALVARLMRERNGYFYAATTYLEARGRPRTLNDLADHDWIAMGTVPQMHAYMTGMGVPVTPDAFRIVSQNGLVAWEMAKAGLGICPMDAEVAAHAPGMERVLPAQLHVPFPIWLVTHREIHTSPRIRLVFDVLAEVLASKTRQS